MECWRGLLRLDVGCPDDLAPFLGFIGHELTEFGVRKRKRRVAKLGDPPRNSCIGKCKIDFLVQLADNFGRRAARRDNSYIDARIIARQNSAKAGISGKTGTRAAVVTAKARSFSALMCSIDDALVPK